MREGGAGVVRCVFPGNGVIVLPDKNDYTAFIYYIALEFGKQEFYVHPRANAVEVLHTFFSRFFLESSFVLKSESASWSSMFVGRTG